MKNSRTHGETVHSGGRMLFPISVGNRRFSFDRVRSALRPLLSGQYSECVFLIADQLHLYNKVRHVASGQELGKALNQFRTRNRELETRKAWLRNLEESFRREGDSKSWTIISSNDVSDVNYAHVHRRLLAAFSAVRSFRDEIQSTARTFLSNRFGDEVNETWCRLSEYYLIEELALNVRVRIWNDIRDEYYLGDFHSPLLRLYGGAYGFTVGDLTGKEVNGLDFRFHHLEAEPAQWEVAVA